MTTMPYGPVAVFDADSPTALAFTRSLGRGGVDVEVYSHRRAPVARFSRYAKACKQSPEVQNAEAFVPWLRRELEQGRIGVVAPTSDAMSYAIACVRDAFPTSVQRALPTRAAAFDCLFKDRFDAACARFGVRTPLSHAPSSIEEARDLASSLPYPVILKPKSHVGVGLARGRVARNADELRALFTPYDIGPDGAALLAEMPGLRFPLIQEAVPGALENLYSVSGVLVDGRAVAFAASRKLGQWPPTLGVGLAFESSHDDEVLSIGTKLVEGVLENGLFELELIRDRRSDSLVAIDLNPRAYGQITLDIARGNDLPLLWYRSAVGEAVAVTGAARKRARWFHSIPYNLEQAMLLARGPHRAARVKSYAQSLLPPRVDIVNDLRDPLPSVPFAAVMLRHPRALLRSFLGNDA